MSIQSLMNKIETVEFDAKYSVVNSLAILEIGLSNDPVIIQLIDELEDENIYQEFTNHMIDLLTEDRSDVLHRSDIIISAYLFALNRVESTNIPELILKRVLDTKGLYWARKYAASLIEMMSPHEA